MESDEDNDCDTGRGFEDNEVHPKNALLCDLGDRLSQDNVDEIALLTVGKIPDKAVSDIKDFKQLADALEKKGVDVLEVLEECNSKMPGGTLYLDNTNHTLKERVQMCKKEIRTAELKKQLSKSRKDDKFIGRIEEMEQILWFLKNKSSHITGVYIWGEMGMGKTALAEEICHKLREYQIVFVNNLRGKRSVHDFLISILHGLCRKRRHQLFYPEKSTVEAQFTENFSHSQENFLDLLDDRFNELQRDTILFLDNVDDIESHSGHGFIVTLQELLSIKTDKVKLLLTNRKPLPRMDIDEQLLLQVEVPPLSRKEAKHLLYTYITDPFPNVPLSEADCDSFVDKCECCPLVIKTVGQQRLVHCLMESPKQSIQACLEVIFDRLQNSFKEMLMELSVFNAAFDANMAAKATGNLAEDVKCGLSDLSLKNMIQMLVEEKGTKDDQPAVVRYSLHPLYLQCLDKECVERSYTRYYQVRQDAKSRFFEYFFQFIAKDGHLREHSYHTFAYLDDMNVHLRNFYSLWMNKGFQLSANKQEYAIILETMCKVLDFGFSRKEQVDFMEAKSRHHQNNPEDVLKEFIVKTHLVISMRNNKDHESAASLIDDLENMQSRIQELSPHDYPSRNVTLARFFSASGLMKKDSAQRCSVRDEKLSLEKESLCNFENALKELSSADCKKAAKLHISLLLEKSKVLNNLGSLYFQMELYEKSFHHHHEAYKCLCEFVKKNYLPKDMYKDIPFCIFNMGAAKQKMYLRYRKSQPSDAKKYLVEAEKHFSRCLNIRKKLGLPDYMVTTMWMLRKGDVHRYLGEPTKAINTCKSALRLLRRKLRKPHVILVEALHTSGLTEYFKDRELRKTASCRVTDAARKSAMYYRRLVELIKRGVLSPDEKIASHIKGVHLKVLELLDDGDLDETTQFYNRFEEKALEFTDNPLKLEDMCEVSSDEDESEENENPQQPTRAKKQDSGFGEPERISVENVQRGVLTKQESIDENCQERSRLQKQVTIDESQNEVHETEDRIGIALAKRDSALGDSFTNSFDSCPG